MADLDGLKKVLRSLVVSSASTMDAASLLRDYRRMLGESLPAAKHGYRDPVLFLRERCSDCFLFAGAQNNPILTLIVPDSIKHIDQLVQNQKTSKLARGKRRSVPESIIKKPQTNLISSTFNKEAVKRIPNGRPVTTPNQPAERTEPAWTYAEARKPDPPVKYVEPSKPEPAPQLATKYEPVPTVRKSESECTDVPSEKGDTQSNGHSVHEEGDSHQRLQRFLKKRMPVYQSQNLGSKESLKDDDSGRQTSSSLSERSATAWANLQSEILRLVAQRPEGLWCGELLRLYEEEYGRELNFARFRYPSVSACASAVRGLTARRASSGDWLLTVQQDQEPRRAPLRLRRAPGRTLLLDDDALPGIDYDPDVYPSDCLNFLESIPAASVAGVAPGDMLPVVVGEVYSPSHLWLQRLGPEHDLMQEIMDEMTEYYSKGEGAERVLAAGARRPGQYCSSVFEGDWHRSLVVQVVDSDTVKVRHVDYGTVDTVAAARLRPLRRAWASLGAQAVRARLAAARPAARCRRWPRAAAAHCLQLVRDRRLVANVVAVDREENILEVLLIDTSTEEDVDVSEQMVRAGHADPRPRPALGARDGYLLPTFSALESGATPGYAEIYALLQHGIALDYVDSYRAHVAPPLPQSGGPSPAPGDGEQQSPASGAGGGECGSDCERGSPSPTPPLADNRVPIAMALLRLAPTPEPAPSAATPPPAPASPPPESPPGAASPPPAFPSPAAAGPPPSTPPAPAAGPPPSPPPHPPPPPHPASFYALPCCPCSPPAPAPLTQHYAPGYFRPRVSPQPYYPPPAPAAVPPLFYRAPQSFVYNMAPHPRQFFPNSMQQFGPNPPIFRPSPPANFVPNLGQNAVQQPVPNSIQSYQQFASPGLNPQNSRPGPPAHFSPGPGQNPQQVGPASTRVAQSVGESSCSAPAPGPAVRLGAEECEVFELLARVDAGAAQRYMLAALRRARGAPPGAATPAAPAAAGLNPDAAEFPAPAMRPPPGFENFIK